MSVVEKIDDWENDSEEFLDENHSERSGALIPKTSMIRDLAARDIRGVYTDVELQTDRRGIINYYTVDTVQKTYRFKRRWWEGNDPVLVMWGQLNIAVLIMDKGFYEQALKVLLGDRKYQMHCHSQDDLKAVFREEYDHIYDLDSWIEKEDEEEDEEEEL